MSKYGHESPMDFEFQNGTGPLDGRSPFAQISQNAQRFPPNLNATKKRMFAEGGGMENRTRLTAIVTGSYSAFDSPSKSRPSHTPSPNNHSQPRQHPSTASSALRESQRMTSMTLPLAKRPDHQRGTTAMRHPKTGIREARLRGSTTHPCLRLLAQKGIARAKKSRAWHGGKVGSCGPRTSSTARAEGRFHVQTTRTRWRSG